MNKLLIALTAGLFAATAAFAQGAASTTGAASAPAASDMSASAPVAASAKKAKKHARRHHAGKAKTEEQQKAASDADTGGTGSK